MKKMLSLLIVMISIVMLGTQVRSQSVIYGLIKDEKGRSLQSANMLLLKSADSTLVKAVISDIDGGYHFERVPVGRYIVGATFTGMGRSYTEIIDVSAANTKINAGLLSLKHDSLSMKNVTVTAKKPLFEQRIDRMVINVKNGITVAGATALDVLEKSPGITVDRQNNNIAINGKTGVTVMINGKINYMPMDGLVQLLAATNAGNIERIELITTPPSKYDAGGNAGFINIVLINNPYAGFSGSYFLTAGYGQRELGAAGLNFNYRSARLNLYGNYALNYNHTIQDGAGFTAFVRGGEPIANASYSSRDCKIAVQNLRIGLDYQLDSATVLGVLAGGYVSHWSMVAHNGATISKNNRQDTIINMVDDPEFNRWQNIMANVNLQHSFRPGQTLFLDANYIYFKDDNPNFYSTDYYNNAKEFLFHEGSKSGKVTPINFRVFSSDYTTPLGSQITMETGAKLSLSKFSNDVSVQNLKQNGWIVDPGLSAKYVLKENIGAAYASFNLKFDKGLSLTAGLRYEYTTSNLGTTQTANIVDRKYGELFPTFYISKKVGETKNINFSYNRRITRPAFNDLAPFTVFFDPKTFFSGNPALQPAIANTLQLSYGLQNYVLSLSYTREKNTIENFYFQTQKIDTVSNILYLSAHNFKSEDYFAASLSAPLTMTSWWSMQNNIHANWRQVNTSIDKVPVRFKIFDYNLNSNQLFTVNEALTFELTGFYTSARYFGTMKLKSIYRVDLGLQKKFDNKKDVLRLAANDIFNSGSDFRFDDNLSVPGTKISRSFNFNLVAYKLTYTHSFGNRLLKGKRERATGAEDELNRVHN